MVRSPDRYGWLPLLVILATGVASFAVLLGLSKLEDHLISRTGRDLQWTAMEIAEKLDLLLFERYGDMRIAAATLEEIKQDPNSAQWERHLKEVQRAYPLYAWIGVLNEKGRVTAATDLDTLGMDLGMDWRKDFGSELAIRVHDVHRNTLSKGREVVAFSAPVTGLVPSKDAADSYDTVMTHIELSEVEKIVIRTLHQIEAKRDTQQGLEYQILNRQGRVILESLPQSNEPADLKALGIEAARLVGEGRTGFVEEKHQRRGVPVLTGYASMPARRELKALEWGVLVRMDREVALAPVRSALWSAATWGGSLLLPLLGVLLWTTVRLREEWRQAEVARQVSKEAHEFHQAIVDNAFDAHILMDQQGIVAGWNHKAKDIFGWSSQEAMGKHLSELIVPPDYREAHEQGLKKFLNTGIGPFLNKRVEIEGWHREARPFPIELTMTALKNSAGYVFSAFVRDVTERVKQQQRQAAEHRIAELLLETASFEAASQEIMRTICETLGWGLGVLWKTDEGSHVLRYVEAWKNTPKKIDRFLDETKRVSLRVGIGLPGRVWETGKVEWLSDVAKDGNFPRAPLAAEVGFHAGFAFPIRLEGKVCAIMEFFTEDIRQPDQKLLDMFNNVAAQLSQFLRRKMAEVAITDAKTGAEQAVGEKMMLLATVEAFFIRLTESGVVCEWTSKAEKLFDISLTDAMGRIFRDLSIAWDWETVSESVNRAAEMVTTVHLDKVLLRGRGDQPRFLKLTVSPLCRDSGIDVVIMGEDITDYLSLERDLAQAQKLESIGQLAAGIAHEINTPTQFVGDNIRFLSDSFSDLLAVLARDRELLVSAKAGNCAPNLIEACEAEMQRADLDYLTEEIPKAIEQSAEGITRVAKIVRAMKDFAHPGSDEKAHANLNAAIESTVTVSHNAWKYVADLTTDLAPDLPPVPCLLNQFNQVILNLIVNAAHAIDDVVKGTGQKGTITITSRQAGEWAEIRMTDSGTGIPEDIQQKIFDPFFTTKEVGKGTGQGLAIARSVVVGKHQGTITVESKVGTGTTFIVCLPLHEPTRMQETELAA